MPPITPSAKRLRSAPSAMCAATQPPAAAVTAWIHSIAGRAQTKTDWNMTNMTAAKTSVPHKRCVNTRSMRSVAVILMAARLDHHAFEHAAGPSVAGRWFRPPAWDSRRRPAWPAPPRCRLAQRPSASCNKRLLQVAADVQQQPPHQTAGQPAGGILLGSAGQFRFQ